MGRRGLVGLQKNSDQCASAEVAPPYPGLFEALTDHHHLACAAPAAMVMAART